MYFFPLLSIDYSEANYVLNHSRQFNLIKIAAVNSFTIISSQRPTHEPRKPCSPARQNEQNLILYQSYQ